MTVSPTAISGRASRRHSARNKSSCTWVSGGVFRSLEQGERAHLPPARGGVVGLVAERDHGGGGRQQDEELGPCKKLPRDGSCKRLLLAHRACWRRQL